MSSAFSLKRMYVVEFNRGAPDLGVSVVMLATDSLAAVEEACRLFPEYKRLCERGRVYEARYVEMDWQHGRCVILRRRLRVRLPKLSPAGEQSGTDSQRGDGNE